VKRWEGRGVSKSNGINALSGLASSRDVNRPLSARLGAPCTKDWARPCRGTPLGMRDELKSGSQNGNSRILGLPLDSIILPSRCLSDAKHLVYYSCQLGGCRNPMRTLMNALAGALLLTAGITAFAGSGLQPPAQPNHPVQSAPQGIPYDWSHHHLIFSRPLTAAKAALLEKEPRYPMQQAWRSRPALSSEGSTAADLPSRASILTTACRIASGMT